MGIIAERITKARKELGLNQKEPAKKVNLTEANLSRYENGIKSQSLLYLQGTEMLSE